MKLSIVADAYALTSSIKVSDIILLKKYKPEALRIRDENDNVKFAISYEEGGGCVSSFGITFGGATRDENGYATITGAIPVVLKTTSEAKEYVAEIFGSVVANLKKLEESVGTEAQKIKDEKQALIDSIEG